MSLLVSEQPCGCWIELRDGHHIEHCCAGHKPSTPARDYEAEIRALEVEVEGLKHTLELWDKECGGRSPREILADLQRVEGERDTWGKRAGETADRLAALWEKHRIQQAEYLRQAADLQRLRGALELPLLFHAGGPWTPTGAARWREITGTDEATTKVMCDAIRAALTGHETGEETG